MLLKSDQPVMGEQKEMNVLQASEAHAHVQGCDLATAPMWMVCPGAIGYSGPLHSGTSAQTPLLQDSSRAAF